MESIGTPIVVCTPTGQLLQSPLTCCLNAEMAVLIGAYTVVIPNASVTGVNLDTLPDRGFRRVGGSNIVVG